jgi:iron complex outermembrane receptor protein
MDLAKVDVFEDSISFTKSANRLSNTVYFDYSKNLGKFYLSAGMATTLNQQFGTYSYGGFDLGYELNEKTRIYLSANSAVRLPTFTDLYYTTSTHQGNVDLKPETSKTLELGAKFNNHGLNINVSTFYRKAENVIDWVKYTTAPKFESKNLAAVNALGAELTADYIFREGFIKKISGSYSYVNFDKNTSADYDSQYALDYLKHKVVFGLQHKVIGDVSVNWNVSYNDRAGDYTVLLATDLPSTVKVAYESFFMLNTRIKYERSKYELYCDINNILNSVYVDYGGLPQPGTNFKLGIKIKITTDRLKS